MGIVDLAIPVSHDVQRLQTSPGGGLLLIEGIVVVAQIEAVFLSEVLIQSEVVLQGIVIRAGYKVPVIAHIQGAGNACR